MDKTVGKAAGKEEKSGERGRYELSGSVMTGVPRGDEMSKKPGRKTMTKNEENGDERRDWWRDVGWGW